MADRDRLRRRLVREAVRENLDMLRGRPPRPLRRSRRFRDALLRDYRLIVAPALLFISISVLSAGGSESRGLPSRAASLEALSARLAFSAPQVVDAAAFPLAVRTIVLDPGHGGADPGAQATAEFTEKEITLDIARRLRILLQESSFDVVMTRERDELISLRERVSVANAAKGDLFVSIHVNAIPTREACGMETYYLGPTNDPHIQQVAVRENAGSGYSLGDFRRLLEGLYVHVRRNESRQFAEVVQRGVVTFLGRLNPAIKDSGVKTAPFVVLVATEMPGILAEVSCLSNDEQARMLADPAYRQNVARGLLLGIRAYAEAHNRIARQGHVHGSQ